MSPSLAVNSGGQPTMFNPAATKTGSGSLVVDEYGDVAGGDASSVLPVVFGGLSRVGIESLSSPEHENDLAGRAA